MLWGYTYVFVFMAETVAPILTLNEQGYQL